ncbi:MAG: preprotein translocase subunit SecA [Dehalococcoidia bacterium]|nr:preprotein translocase subunit SecA [Dehalococcoidia bacterium]
MKWLGSLLDSNERELKRLHPVMERINALEQEVERLSDAELRARTEEFRLRIGDGESLDNILTQAFAVVREAAQRTIGLRLFDVQLLGGMVLHQGQIAEMKTGEGKTLMATLPLYLNALSSQGAHLVTVNDYLARRDTHWMGPVYHFLGLKAACIYQDASFVFDPEQTSQDDRWPHLHPVSRGEAYQADITYGTNYEFGFDYLRDNMALELSQIGQRPLNYAIVDEVDYVLIDEARTPLIISGPAQESTDRYASFARLVARLQPEEDYEIDEKYRAVNLTEEGLTRAEKLLRVDGLLKGANLYDSTNYSLLFFLEAALKARALFRRDRDYVVKDGHVIIVDEFTGRLMAGRRYSEGLHQAIEAKEGVKVQRETVTMASITYQNYFRMYRKLAGMTGTAVTEAEEFNKIYKLDVLSIPTHRPMVRRDDVDRVYRSEEAKCGAVAAEVAMLHKEGRPVLVGTGSIESNEFLSEVFKRRGIPHNVLNAKQHEKEALIISQAGQPGAVTVATNMAGRGVDIVLGEGVADIGGLFVLGTERHEARRIDNQLRGRSGRQGDPGVSAFFISVEDDLIRRFGGGRLGKVMDWAGLGDDTPLESSIVGKLFENAQMKMEAHNFDIRKHLLDYDDVLNRQREIIYQERRKVLEGTDLRANIGVMLREEIDRLVESYLPDEYGTGWDTEGFFEELAAIFPQRPQLSLDGVSPADVKQKLTEHARRFYDERVGEVGDESMRAVERVVVLSTIDMLWTEHLTRMEQIRHGIGLRAVAQTDPLVAYKREGHQMFQSLLSSIRHDVVRTVLRVRMAEQHTRPMPRQAVLAGQQVGRNDPCPCGSGKKYKRCHGR